MTKPKTYKLTKISDLLLVPPERRRDCLRSLLYALELHELAFGAEAKDTAWNNVTWTDDGNHSATLRDQHGNDVASLEVKE